MRDRFRQDCLALICPTATNIRKLEELTCMNGSERDKTGGPTLVGDSA